MEILKQKQYAPMPVEEQVVSLYVAVNNHLEDIDVGDVGRFEEAWLRFVEEHHGDVLGTIRQEKRMTDEIRTQLEHAVEEFKERFAS
jgi:F-type H+-transporting ATPase subunit alpha